MASRMSPRKPSSAGAVRSVTYSTSPLLASKTPPWRSKFLVALVGASFCVLLGRALYVQVIGTAFFQKQGEIRYARTLELPASRGRILDRNGLILASSIPAPSLWAIPKDFDADKNQRKQLARLLGMAPKELEKILDFAASIMPRCIRWPPVLSAMPVCGTPCWPRSQAVSAAP